MGWFEDQVLAAAEKLYAPSKPTTGEKIMAGQTKHITGLANVVTNARSAINRAKAAGEALNAHAGELVDNIAKVESITQELHDTNQGLAQVIAEMTSEDDTQPGPLSSTSAPAPASTASPPVSTFSENSSISSATGPTAPVPAPQTTQAQSPSPQAPIPSAPASIGANAGGNVGDVSGHAGEGQVGSKPEKTGSGVAPSTSPEPAPHIDTGNAARDLSNAALLVGKKNRP